LGLRVNLHLPHALNLRHAHQFIAARLLRGLPLLLLCSHKAAQAFGLICH
jgi:hypothetical protein